MKFSINKRYNGKQRASVCERETENLRQRKRERGRERGRERERERERGRERKRDKERDREREKENRERETDRQTVKQRERVLNNQQLKKPYASGEKTVFKLFSFCFLNCVKTDIHCFSLKAS